MGEPERILIYDVTSNFFPLLGATPLLGRGFFIREERPGSMPAIVLGYGFWVSHFARDPAILGKTVALEGRPAEIVGVMNPAFNFPEGVRLWRCIGSSRAAQSASREPQGGYHIVGRLRPNATIAQAQAELDVISKRVAEVAPACKGWVTNVTSLKWYMVHEVTNPLLLVLCAVVFVLLVACANVANMLLARAVARQREIAMRLALGATRFRIARQLFTEAMLLAIAGGIAGFLLSIWGLPAVLSFAGSRLPRMAGIGLNWRVLAAAASAAIATGLLFGLAPAFYSVRRVAPSVVRSP